MLVAGCWSLVAGCWSLVQGAGVIEIAIGIAIGIGIEKRRSMSIPVRSRRSHEMGRAPTRRIAYNRFDIDPDSCVP